MPNESSESVRVSLYLNKNLVDDMYFELGKIHGKVDPETSLAKYVYEKLRPLVPERNIQVIGNLSDDIEPKSTNS